jgi:hypothetical protein
MICAHLTIILSLELRYYDNALDIHKHLALRFPGRYLTSNVNITVPGSDGSNVSVPIGSRYAKFKTLLGRKITSLGTTVTHKGAAGTIIQPLTEMVHEAWFAEAIAEEPDVFLLVGHIPVSDGEWPIVHQAIRAVHPHTPIMMFGGHSHHRACVQFDRRSMALESGMYMQTVGWMSMELPAENTSPDDAITFTRRYLDANRVTYQYHTAQSESTFDTPEGSEISAGLRALAEQFGLSHTYGVVPQDYQDFGVPHTSEDSLFHLLATKVLPFALAHNNARAARPHYIIFASGSPRFGLFAGSFTKDDELLVLPRANRFLYIPNVLAGVARQLVSLLNRDGSDGKERPESVREVNPSTFDTSSGLTPGHVTIDCCPDAGDDTPHLPMSHYIPPPYLGCPFPDVLDTDPIDVVFVDFIKTDLISSLNTAQNAITYTDGDAHLYSPLRLNKVLSVYAQLQWS